MMGPDHQTTCSFWHPEWRVIPQPLIDLTGGEAGGTERDSEMLAGRPSIWTESAFSVRLSQGHQLGERGRVRCGKRTMPGSAAGFLSDAECRFAVCGHEFQVRLHSHVSFSSCWSACAAKVDGWG